MSLLLSNDMFSLDADCTGRGDDSYNTAALPVYDSLDCEETNENLRMNEELDESQCERHSDVDCDDERLADSIGDVVRNSDRSTISSTDTSCHTEPNTGDESHEVNVHRQHGVHSFRYALHIDITSHVTVEQTEDNADVVRTLHELTTLLLNRYMPTVKRWLEVNVHHFGLYESMFSVCIFRVCKL